MPQNTPPHITSTKPLKRSLTISGHRTSVSLENEFWDGLREIAQLENKSINQLVRDIDKNRGTANLSSSIRIRVLNFYKAQIADALVDKASNVCA